MTVLHILFTSRLILAMVNIEPSPKNDDSVFRDYFNCQDARRSRVLADIYGRKRNDFDF